MTAPSLPLPSPAKLVETALIHAPTTPKEETLDHPLAKKQLCVTCGSEISYAEGKFCWNNGKRFGGLQCCRDHQALAK